MALKRAADAFVPAKPSGPLRNWGTQHVLMSKAALARLLAQPFASLMTVLVIAVTLALPAAMQLAIKNVQSLSGGWESALDFSLYLAPGTAAEDARQLAGLLAQRADVEEVTLIPADEAFAEFRETSGFGAALEHLSENPLPHTIVIRPASNNTEESIRLMHEELANLPEADFVQADTEWVRRFHAILAIAERAVGIAAGLLAAAIVIVIGNTIRLDIQNRREEIEVTKLIGASNGFVRRPFLYSGLWYGLGGGLLALLLVAAGLLALEEPAARLAGLYGSSLSILALSPQESLLIVATGMALGLAGSWLAVARHLRRIEPH